MVNNRDEYNFIRAHRGQLETILELGGELALNRPDFTVVTGDTGQLQTVPTYLYRAIGPLEGLQAHVDARAAIDAQHALEASVCVDGLRDFARAANGDDPADGTRLVYAVRLLPTTSYAHQDQELRYAAYATGRPEPTAEQVSVWYRDKDDINMVTISRSGWQMQARTDLRSAKTPLLLDIDDLQAAGRVPVGDGTLTRVCINALGGKRQSIDHLSNWVGLYGRQPAVRDLMLSIIEEGVRVMEDIPPTGPTLPSPDTLDAIYDQLFRVQNHRVD